MVKLKVFAPQGIRTFEFSDPVVTVGRDRDNHLAIGDPLLSRKHCLFEKSGETLQVVDLKSANGTFVNGVRVKHKVLQLYDRIKIGNTILFLLSLES